MHVPAIMNHRHPRLYDEGFGDDLALWEASSPVHHLTKPGAHPDAVEAFLASLDPGVAALVKP
jgi:hypothetical protein